MILSTHQHRVRFKVGDKPIKQVNEAKLLDIIIDENLTWDKHIYKMCNVGSAEKIKEIYT